MSKKKNKSPFSPKDFAILPTGKMETQVAGLLVTVLEGRLLSIDPSSGSRQSMPGYAIWESGKLKDSGVLQIEYSDYVNVRLQRIADSLRNEFEVPDILVIENIPPKIGFGRGPLNLHRAVGAIMSAVRCGPIIEVAPISWRKYIPEGYRKTDENDAIMFGYCVIATAYKLKQGEVPALEDIIDVSIEQLREE